MTIKFNNLINKTNLIEKKINKFLKINIHLNLKRTQKKKKWKINSSGEKNNTYGQKWKIQMRIEEIAIIEKICSKMMKQFKFSLYFKNFLQRDLYVNNFRENKKKILKWTAKNIFFRYDKEKIKKL